MALPALRQQGLDGIDASSMRPAAIGRLVATGAASCGVHDTATTRAAAGSADPLQAAATPSTASVHKIIDAGTIDGDADAVGKRTEATRLHRRDIDEDAAQRTVDADAAGQGLGREQQGPGPERAKADEEGAAVRRMRHRQFRSSFRHQAC